MRPEELQLLLRKQALQLRIEQQRAQCIELLCAAEGVARGMRQWQALGARLGAILREHAALLGIPAAALLLLLRPRATRRWLRRGWLLWLGWRRHRPLLHSFARLLLRAARA